MVGETASTLLRASLARTGRWAGGVGLVGGFVADVLNPLAPFAAYIALAGAVAIAPSSSSIHSQRAS